MRRCRKVRVSSSCAPWCRMPSGVGDIGYLYAVLNWDVVRRSWRTMSMTRRADRPAARHRRQRVIAAVRFLSAELDDRDLEAACGRDRTPAGPRIRSWSVNVAGAGSLLVGAAASTGYQHFTGFGWHMLVVEPTRVAFAPVWRLAWVILAGLVFSLAVAGWLSVRLSNRLASPIGQLTDFARDFRSGQTQELPAATDRHQRGRRIQPSLRRNDPGPGTAPANTWSEPASWRWSARWRPSWPTRCAPRWASSSPRPRCWNARPRTVTAGPGTDRLHRQRDRASEPAGHDPAGMRLAAAAAVPAPRSARDHPARHRPGRRQGGKKNITA